MYALKDGISNPIDPRRISMVAAQSTASKDFNKEDLVKTAAQLAAKGKGLLASDESTGTIGKRLEKAGIANTAV